MSGIKTPLFSLAADLIRFLQINTCIIICICKVIESGLQGIYEQNHFYLRLCTLKKMKIVTKL